MHSSLPTCAAYEVTRHRPQRGLRILCRLCVLNADAQPHLAHQGLQGVQRGQLAC